MARSEVKLSLHHDMADLSSEISPVGTTPQPFLQSVEESPHAFFLNIHYHE